VARFETLPMQLFDDPLGPDAAKETHKIPVKYLLHPTRMSTRDLQIAG
jgi:hypothetical protein